MLFVPVGLWMSALGVVGLALNLRAYESENSQQKTQNLKHSIQKSIIKRRYSCMDGLKTNQRLVFPEEVLPSL
jgi:photosystem II P680 reaction center D2 protein